MRRMRAIFPAIAIASAVLLAGCSGAAETEETEDTSFEGATPAEFAAVTCTAWNASEAAFDEGLSTAQLTEEGTGEEQRASVVAITEGWLNVMQTQHDAIAEATPAVENGDAIGKLFTDHFETIITAGTPLIDEFRGFSTEVGPNGGDVTFGALQLFTALNDTDSGLSFPFTDVEDQDLIKAFGEEASCSGVVRTYGGS